MVYEPYEACKSILLVLIKTALLFKSSTAAISGRGHHSLIDTPINIAIITKDSLDGSILPNVSVQYFLKLARKGNFTSSRYRMLPQLIMLNKY